MTRLSIIIPHYNSVNLLEKLLDTIPNHHDIQVIVVDDKSNENIKKIYNNLEIKYSQRNIEFYENNSNKKGAGTCRNIGIEHANGEWVIFADSDDYFLPDFYKIVNKYFGTSNDVVFFKPISIELDTGNLSDRHINYEKLIDDFLMGKQNSELYLRYFYYVPWSKLIKVDFIKKYKLKFDEVIASNDVMFSTKLGHYAKNIEVSNEVIYCVTRNSGSLTTVVSNEVFNSRLDVFIRYYWFLKKNLSEDDFKLLNLNGMGFVINSLELGIKNMFKTLIKLNKNKIKLFSYKYLNLLHVINKLRDLYIEKRNLKKYSKD